MSFHNFCVAILHDLAAAVVAFHVLGTFGGIVLEVCAIEEHFTGCGDAEAFFRGTFIFELGHGRRGRGGLLLDAFLIGLWHR